MKDWGSRGSLTFGIVVVSVSALVVSGCSRKTAQQTKPKPPLVVALQPYLGIDDRSVETARKAITAVSGARVVVLTPMPLPKSAYYRPRHRYRAEKIIAALNRQPFTHVVGLTNEDISTTKGNHPDWGLFGLGDCPGQSCVVSTARLGGRTDRLRKVVVHEFGHTLGLPHCPTPHCLMNDAMGKAATVDAETGYCKKCLTKGKGLLRNMSGLQSRA